LSNLNQQDVRKHKKMFMRVKAKAKVTALKRIKKIQDQNQLEERKHINMLARMKVRVLKKKRKL
jgi:acetyl-CoA carboxylase beta subunit